MPRKANYPDWVTKHLQPGQYINKQGDAYYVYAAHSERREGVSHPVRVSDGYLGRITEQKGFIPARKRGTPRSADNTPRPFQPTVWNYGTHVAVYLRSLKILDALRTSYRAHGTFIYISAVLTFLYGSYSYELYQISVLSLLFPNVSFPKEISSETMTGIERGTRMIRETINNAYSDDWPLMKASLSVSVLIRNRKSYTIPLPPPSATAFADKYQLPLSEEAALALVKSFQK